ncbi:MAG: hypothetical protein QF535_11035 [Anaerolineales bacterium]|nr:hypothetical protein [Anaerolineales bacterium]
MILLLSVVSAHASSAVVFPNTHEEDDAVLLPEGQAGHVSFADM